MNRRRVLADLLCAALVPAVAPLSAFALSGKPPPVVWLVKPQVGGDLKPVQTEADVRAAFATLGLVDGRDMALTFAEFPNAQGDSGDPANAETQAFIARIVASRPAAIVTLARPALWVLRRATREVPIVFYNLAYDPSKVGLVESLRRPGGNVTGTDVGWLEMQTRQWQLLNDLVPSMKRAGFLTGIRVPEATAQNGMFEAFERLGREMLQQVSARFGFEIVEIEISRGAPEKEVFEALMQARVEGVYVDMEMTSQVDSALKRLKLPSCGGLIRNVRRGLLMGMTFDFSEGERHAATIVARILRGEHPSTIPVYRTTKYYLYLNRGTARAIGMTFPASILVQAEEVID